MDLQAILAQGVGLVATCIAFLSFQCKDTRKLFLYQMLSAAVWALHFGLLGASTGLLLNVAGMIRCIFLYNADKRWARSNVSMVLVTLLMAVCGIITWSGWICVLPIIAMVVGTPVMWQQKGKLLRWVQLFIISPFWLIYNISNASIAGILTESLNMISVVVSLVRFRNQKLENGEKQA